MGDGEIGGLSEAFPRAELNRSHRALLLTEARLLPNILEGRQQGFVLTEMKPGGIYQSIGLQDGDVLLRINDFDISSPESALQAFTALKGMDVVQLDIIRDGTPMTLTYRIQ
jgi:general secretion pathway protein C